MKHYIIIFYCILLLPTLGYSQGTRTLEELIFKAPDSDNETCYITIEAVNGLTRWALDDEIKLPTEGRDSFYGKFYKSKEPTTWGLHAPDDPQEAGGDDTLSWGKYEISFSSSDGEGFGRAFYLDVRDADWTQGGYLMSDIDIIFYPDVGVDSLKLKARISKIDSNWVTANEVINVWDLANRVQNKRSLLVPVTATNN